jgi:hypothetical protein
MGAAIAGALVVLAICLLLEREDFSYGLVVAFGAVGVGFGGQETYGQTVGFGCWSMRKCSWAALSWSRWFSR